MKMYRSVNFNNDKTTTYLIEFKIRWLRRRMCKTICLGLINPWFAQLNLKLIEKKFSQHLNYMINSLIDKLIALNI